MAVKFGIRLEEFRLSVVDAVRIVEMQIGTFVMLSPVHELMEMDVVAEKHEEMMVEDSTTVDSDVSEASLRSTGITKSPKAVLSRNRNEYLEAIPNRCIVPNAPQEERQASRTKW